MVTAGCKIYIGDGNPYRCQRMSSLFFRWKAVSPTRERASPCCKTWACTL